MLDEVIAGVLVNVIGATGRRVSVAIGSRRSRRSADDLAVARWFDTYSLALPVPSIDEGLSSGEQEYLAAVLRSDEIQATLHELLAARLTDAPEADVARIRQVFSLVLEHAGHGLTRLGTALFDYFDSEICSLVGRLEGDSPDLLSQIREEAMAARIIAILHAIERHAAAVAAEPGPAVAEDFLARYRRHVTEHHGRIEPPDFDRRRRIPVADLYVPPPIFEIVEADPDRRSRRVNLWNLADDIDRTVLLGDPGAGKTTAANVLMYHCAERPNRPVPFLVTVREFAAHNPPERSVAGHLERKLDAFYQCPAPAGLMVRLLLTGACLVIFDGMDELTDTTRRAEVTSIIERFATEYPLAKILVTSRLVGYDQARLDDRQFTCFRIGWLDDEQVDTYVHRWFGQEPDIQADQARRWAESFMEESGTVTDLRANPLMLALMCILYRGEGSLPRNRAEIYEQCANLLFRKWDARRHIHLDLRAGHLLEPALRHVAWWMFTRSQAQPAVTERELVEQTAAFLHGRGFESVTAARESAAEFVGFCRGRMWVFSDVGTTAAGKPLYGFTHRTFLEYFAAAHLSYACDAPERLARTVAPHVARHEWEVVGELAVQIKEHTSDRGAQRVYETLLTERRRRSVTGRSGVLQFLARCLRSVEPPPRTVRDLSGQVLDHLLAGDLDDRARCLPLCWLLASCGACRDIVSEEIDARAAMLVESGDHLDGLRLAVALPVGIRGNWGGEGPRLPPEGPQRRFWDEHCRHNVDLYASHINAASVTDPGVRSLALRYKTLGIDDALMMPDGPLVLFKRHWIGIFGWWLGAYLPDAVCDLSLGTTGPASSARADLAAFGRFLLEHPRLPWITGEPNAWSEFFWGHAVEQQMPRPLPDPITYLGAAATLLIATEGMRTKMLPSEGPQRFTPLEDLYPYIARRWRAEPRRQLPSLPVPESFQTTFRDWADNKINFADSGVTADPLPGTAGL